MICVKKRHIEKSDTLVIRRSENTTILICSLTIFNYINKRYATINNVLLYDHLPYVFIQGKFFSLYSSPSEEYKNIKKQYSPE